MSDFNNHSSIPPDTDRRQPHPLGKFTRVTLLVAVILGAIGYAGLSDSADTASQIMKAWTNSPATAGDASSTNSIEFLLAAGMKSAKQSSVRTKMTMDIGGTDLEVDLSADRAMTVMDGTVSIPRMGKVPVRYVGDLIYYGFPNLPVGKMWVAVTNDELKQLTGIDLAKTRAQQNPFGSLELLNRLRGSATELGAEPVEGISTTHFRAGINLQDALAAATGSGAVSDGAADSARDTLGDEATLDVWVDADGFVRRIHCEFTLDGSRSTLASPSAKTMTLDAVMSDYGHPVSVQAPDAAETMSLTEMKSTLAGR